MCDLWLWPFATVSTKRDTTVLGIKEILCSDEDVDMHFYCVVNCTWQDYQASCNLVTGDGEMISDVSVYLENLI